MKHAFRSLAPLAALAAAAVGAGAQNDAKPDAPSGYRSVFEDYRPYEELPPPEHWREANDGLSRSAGRHGGHGEAPARTKPEPHSSHGGGSMPPTHDRHEKDSR